MNRDVQPTPQLLTADAFDMPAQMILADLGNGPKWYTETLSNCGAISLEDAFKRKGATAWRVAVRIELPDPREIAEQFPEGGSVELRAYLPEACTESL